MSGSKIFTLQYLYVTSAKPCHKRTNKLISSLIHTRLEKRNEQKQLYQNNCLETLRNIVGMIRRFGISFRSHTQAW